jgi:SAM-dependent methyltransferase
MRLTRKRTGRTASKTRRQRSRAPGAPGPQDGFETLPALFEGISGWGIKTGPGLEPYKTTYGEVTPEGIRALEGHFTRSSGGTPLSKLPADQRAFYDLGCGVGKVVIGMAMLRPELAPCVGIEIVPERIEGARQAVGRLRHKGLAGRCSFRVGSFLGPDVNFRDAAWIYISNLCFDEGTQGGLAQKLQGECRPGCVIACSKALPLAEGSHLRLVESGAGVPMSWSAESTVHLYRVE